MNMKVLFKVVVILLATIVAGCAANGSHDYYNGKCVTCRNDFMAGEMLDYESKGTNNYTQLSWRELMFEGLARNGDTDMLPYGEDYLKHRIGNKAISLQSNEIAYRREIVKSSSELDASLAQHSLKKATKSPCRLSWAHTILLGRSFLCDLLKALRLPAVTI